MSSHELQLILCATINIVVEVGFEYVNFKQMNN